MGAATERPIWSVGLWHEPIQERVEAMLASSLECGAACIGHDACKSVKPGWSERDFDRFLDGVSEDSITLRNFFTGIRPGDWIVARYSASIRAVGIARRPSSAAVRRATKAGGVLLPTGMVYRRRADLEEKGLYAYTLSSVRWVKLEKPRSYKGLPRTGPTVIRLHKAEKAVRELCLATMPAKYHPTDAPQDGEGEAEQVPIEGGSLEPSSVRREKSSAKIEKAEKKLVAAYKSHMPKGRLTRFRLKPPGARSNLYCDIFDGEAANLVEAKGSVSRGAIRMAIGQLMDYAYLIPHKKPLRLGILLPRRPTADVEAMLKHNGVHVVWRSAKHGFKDNAGGKFVT